MAKSYKALRVNLLTISGSFFLLLLLLLSSTSCSTKKNTFASRTFHNVTANYNPYWNGHEAFKQAVAQLNEQIKTDYTQLLPVEDFGTLQQVQSVNSNLNRAIEKGTKVIQNHSMYYERRERVKKVMESYMLIGKAYFYRQDYYDARQAFEFVARRFERDPIRFEAQLWQARTAIQLREFERSITILDQLQTQVRRKDFPKWLKKEIPIVYASHHVSQQNYQAAKPHLNRAAESNPDRKIKARMYYILGQIHQMEGSLSQASNYYKRVLKLRPGYEMSFNAQISLAQCYQGGDSRQIYSDLNKLLRQPKNREFNDQIYYAMAQLSLQEGKYDDAIDYLRLSVSTSVSNDFQKSLSARMLADIYYDRNDYFESYAYYDTTMQSLAYNHPDFNYLERKTNALRSLTDHLFTILHQDSLQRVAAMPENERLAIVDGIIAEVRAEQQRLKQEEEALALAERPVMVSPGRDPTRGLLQQTSGGAWYFYNPQAISYGLSEFTRKWGRRKLEDNWRLSDKRSYSFDVAEVFEEETEMLDEDGKPIQPNDPLRRETYLDNLPFTPEQIEQSNGLIANSTYQVGYIFREDLHEFEKSAESFERFISRFPDDERELNALYHLYTLNMLMTNFAKADEYKNRIIRKFPESDYALRLSDPDYYTKLEAEARRVSALYEDTYLAYSGKQYRMVVIYSNEAETSYPDSPLIPNFAFLKALSVGNMYSQHQDTLIRQLQHFIAQHSSSALVANAQGILAALGLEGFEEEDFLSEPKEEAEDEAISIYSLAPGSSHLFVTILNLNRTNVDATRIRISDFNTTNYKVQNLTINTVMIDSDHQMISISPFADQARAMAYYHAIVASDYVFPPQLKRDAVYFVISSENYPVFYRDKSIETYMKFFEKNYLSN